LGKRVTICILVTIAMFAVLSSLPYRSVAGYQAQTTSTTSNSTTTASIISSTSISNTSTTSTESYASTSTSTSLSSTTDSTSSSNTITATGSVSNSSSATSDITSLTSTDSGWITVTMTSTTTTVATFETGTSSTSSADYSWNHQPTYQPATCQPGYPGYTCYPSSDYSISFSPEYWLCTDASVTFTGPLVESGHYGDNLQFQYFQYNPSYPSVLYPIFTDPGLTVTSDTVNYWINYNEYAQVNFAYLPNLAVKVVDVTPNSRGYAPGLIFMELTNITPAGGQYCQFDSPLPTPEFQAQWLMIIASVGLGLLFLRIHKHHARLVHGGSHGRGGPQWRPALLQHTAQERPKDL